MHNISAFDSDNGLAPTRRQAIIWNNAGGVYRHIYAELGTGDELTIFLETVLYLYNSTGVDKWINPDGPI